MDDDIHPISEDGVIDNLFNVIDTTPNTVVTSPGSVWYVTGNSPNSGYVHKIAADGSDAEALLFNGQGVDAYRLTTGNLVVIGNIPLPAGQLGAVNLALIQATNREQRLLRQTAVKLRKVD